MCAGEEIALLGGGNSAGQAVVYLAPKVKKLHLVIRGEGLEASMSKYLIDRIQALPNVELHTGTELLSLEADDQGALSSATYRERATGATHVCKLRHLFLFIGADPNTDWLKGCVTLDQAGFVVTGADGAALLETDRAGVFAIGDVRAGSVKRVAAAVGEGAAVVAQIHQYLAALEAPPTPVA
jgi:thioredoxin reductase (NADPH)